MNKIVLTVSDEHDGLRLDKYFSECIDSLSRSAVAKLISDGFAYVNGVAVQKSFVLKADDEASLIIPDAKPLEVTPEDITLDIYYEDEDLLVVNKPKGMVVHPAAGNYSGTLVNALLYHCKDSLSGINGIYRPGIVHRIDKDTSGLLLVAKNDLAHASLANQLFEHSVNRIYQAVAYGTNLPDEGDVIAPIYRSQKDRKKMAVVDTGKYAETHYKVLGRYRGFSHIECKLKTGRTHQIRVHMAYIGHPLAGDTLYGPSNVISKLQGQCLHAGTIGFVHPRTNEYMEFVAPLPKYFQSFLNTLGERYD